MIPRLDATDAVVMLLVAFDVPDQVGMTLGGLVERQDEAAGMLLDRVEMNLEEQRHARLFAEQILREPENADLHEEARQVLRYLRELA